MSLALPSSDSARPHTHSLDNSSYAINGDYTPTRFAAQKDAATVLFNVKANSNPENVIGLMTMGGRGSVWPVPPAA